MNNSLFNYQPKRLFTFGCSFTHYNWGTWANCLAKELEPVEFINLGRSGAGNQYIFNMVMQADSIYNFTHEDLVVVQWTNVCREDRFIPQLGEGGWHVPGNIYSQQTYDSEFVRKYFNEKGAYVRDLASIKATYEMLKHRTQWHFLQMCDIIDQPAQWGNQEGIADKRVEDWELDELIKTYHEPLSNIKPSFYNILYNNNIQTKFDKDRKLINKGFFDGHPSPIEHLMYLKGVFNHEWKDSTDRAVEETQQTWVKMLQDASKGKKNFNINQTKQRYQDMFFYETKIVGPSYIEHTFIR